MQAFSNALQLPAPLLDVREPELYLDSTRKGYFALLRTDPMAGAARRQWLLAQGADPKRLGSWMDHIQTMHKLSELPRVLERYQGASDVYISQLMFRHPPKTRDGKPRAPNRQKQNAAFTRVCFIDLDIRIERFQVNTFLNEIFEDMSTASIPCPSYVVFSGRGFHFKWLLEQDIPAAAMSRWDLLQRGLSDKLTATGWNVDQKAIDRSRVLRLPGTINTRSDRREVCEVVWANRVTGDHMIRRYGFDELCDLILPYTRTEYAARRQREYEERGRLWEAQREQRQRRYEEQGRKWAQEKIERKRCQGVQGSGTAHQRSTSDTTPTGKGRGSFNPRALSRDRGKDLLKLLSLRESVPEDATADREAIIFWTVVFEGLSGSTFDRDFVTRARSLAAAHCPQNWAARHHDRWDSHLSTLRTRFKAWHTGKRDGVYTPRNTTLIAILKITPSEERAMKTIIGPEEKLRRRRDRARANGVPSRQAYLAANSASRSKPWQSVGISRATYYRRLSRKVG